MRLFFYTILGLSFFAVSAAMAEGLPANPWVSRTTVVDNTIAVVSRERQTQPQGQVAGTNVEMQELSAAAIAVKDKLLNNAKTVNSAPVNPSENQVSSLEALNAANTLSKFMQQNAPQTTVNTNASVDFGAMMRKLQDNKNKSSMSTPKNNFSSPQINKAKNQYNHYKSKVVNGYNDLKNKTEPIYREVSKGFKEVEKTTGVKF